MRRKGLPALYHAPSGPRHVPVTASGRHRAVRPHLSTISTLTPRRRHRPRRPPSVRPPVASSALVVFVVPALFALVVTSLLLVVVF